MKALPLIGEIDISPSPCPLNIGVAKAKAPNGAVFIVMQFATSTGVQQYFIEEAAAKQVIAMLEANVGAGLVLAPTMPGSSRLH